MPIRPIVIHGEPVLHRRAEAVTEFDAQLHRLVEDMYLTQDAANGVGLAAPQIGVGLRIFTWKMKNSDGVPELGHIVNPYVKASKPPAGEPDRDEESEGCLSFPGYSFPLRRGEHAHVTGYDIDGNELEFDATGWFARCMQHEYDHLNGFLYVNRLQPKWEKKAKKVARANHWTEPGHFWTPGQDKDPFGHDDVEGGDRVEGSVDVTTERLGAAPAAAAAQGVDETAAVAERRAAAKDAR